jgi:hypothetical protein
MKNSIVVFLAVISVVLCFVSCQSTKAQNVETTEEIIVSGTHLDYIEANMDKGFVTGKTDYQVQAKMVSKPTHVYNALELVSYDVEDDNVSVVLKGTLDEEWVTKVSKVIKTYENLDGSAITEEQFISSKDEWTTIKTKATPGANYALLVPADTILEVQTAWGDVLYTNASKVDHGKGDYLVCNNKDGVPDLSDVWVVNGALFAKTYDMTNAK